MSSLARHRAQTALSIVIVLAFLVAGCGPASPAPAATSAPAGETEVAEQATAPAGETPAAQEPTAAPQPAKQVTIKMLAMQQAGLTPDEMDEIAAKFSAANPGVKIDITYVAYDALHDKIVTSLSGTTPGYDVFLVDDIWFAGFVKAGWLLDITDRITPEMREDVFKTDWDVPTVNGRVYGMPWLVDVKHFYYNKDLLAQAGFNAPPTTWEEMAEMGKKMKDAGLVEYPIIWSWAQAEAVIADFVALLYGNGGEFFDKDGKPVFNNERGVEVLTWMVKSIEDGISNPSSISSVEEDVRNVFSQGKAAFALNWMYMYDLAQNNSQESQITGKVGMALMPVFKRGADEGIKSSTMNGPMGISIAAKSPNADVAWEWVKFMTSKPIQMEYSAHLMPIWSSCFKEPDIDALLKVNPSNPVTMPIFSAQVPYAHLRPKVPYYTEASLAIQLAIQEALTKQKTPKQALDEAVAKILEIQAKQQ